MKDQLTLWERAKKDMKINKPLLPLKAVMFFFYGSTTMFLPYITLHMVKIGITIEEVAIIYAILPFATCLGPPIAGMIADRTGRYKLVLITSMFLMGLLHTMLLLIDAQGIDPALVAAAANSSQANSSLAELSCDSSGQLSLQWPICGANGTCADPGDLIVVRSSDCDLSCVGGDELTFHLRSEPPWLAADDLCSQSVRYSDDNESGQSCPCPVRCSVEVAALSCPPAFELEFDTAKHNRGFWLYLVCRILATACLGTSFTMLDASTICLVKKHKGELGKQRLCGVIGSSIFGVGAGFVMEWFSSEGERNYAVLFYASDILMLLVISFLFIVDVTADKNEGHFWRNVLRLVKLVDVDIFMAMMLVLGTCWGYLEAYLFIFLVELKATSFLLGLTVTIGSLVGLPFLYISEFIVLKLGKIGILLTAFFIYSIRFFGYSFITDPWLSLPFEALEAVTIHLMAVSMSLFCASAAPTGLLATLHGLSGGIHYSVGRGLGSFLGGILISTYGSRITFRILGSVAGTSGLLFIGLYFLTPMRKIDQRRLKQAARRDHVNVTFAPVEKSEPINVDPESMRNFLSVPQADFAGRRFSS